MKTRILLTGFLGIGVSILHAAPLTQSTFTEIIKDVNVVAQATKAAEPAKVNEIVKAPDLVRTGPDSRAELTAPDQTLTRIGANTIFTFEPAGRNIDLQQGSVLFHSPTGKGGGSIRSGGASAAVLGTTIIVAATPNGGFKVIVLEGKGRVKLPGGRSVSLRAGQMVFVLPGQGAPGPVLTVNLARLVGGSLLVHGFSRELPSMPRIQAAMNQQNKEIAEGQAEDTGISADNFAGSPPLGNGLDAQDNGTYQVGIHPPLNPVQLDAIFQRPASGAPGGHVPGSAVGTGLVPISPR